MPQHGGSGIPHACLKHRMSNPAVLRHPPRMNLCSTTIQDGEGMCSGLRLPSRTSAAANSSSRRKMSGTMRHGRRSRRPSRLRRNRLGPPISRCTSQSRGGRTRCGWCESVLAFMYVTIRIFKSPILGEVNRQWAHQWGSRQKSAALAHQLSLFSF